MDNPLNNKKAYFTGKATVVFNFLNILATTVELEKQNIKLEVN